MESRSEIAICVQRFTVYLCFLAASAWAAYPPTMSPSQKLGKNITVILNHLVSTEHYDKRLRPNYGGDPVDVGVTIHVSSISAVSEVEMDYTLDMYMRQMWNDPRLKFQAQGGVNDLTIDVEYLKSIWVPDTFFPNEKKSFFHIATTHNSFLRITNDGNVTTSQRWTDPRLAFSHMNANLTALTVGIEYVRHIWVPDTFFPNEKKSFFHKATTHNSFLRISPTGEIKTSQRLTVTATCPMALQLFPLDSQKCSLEIESYGYSTNDIKYTWFTGKGSVTKGNVTLPQFKVADFDIHEISAQLSTGTYSRLVCNFLFTRSIGFYMIQIYLPSILIVIISWVSFWLSRDATPARVALGVTTVLTMTTLMTTTNAAMPKVSYIKSIDVYLGTCFLMVFASLLEYAAVGYLNKRMRMKKEKQIRATPQSSAGPNALSPFAAGGNSPLPTSNPRLPLLPLPGDRGYRPLTGLQSPPPVLNSSNYQVECDCDIEKATIKSIKLTAPRKRNLGVSPSAIDKYSRIVFPLTSRR